jgi:hypothetical protein
VVANQLNIVMPPDPSVMLSFRLVCFSCCSTGGLQAVCSRSVVQFQIPVTAKLGSKDVERLDDEGFVSLIPQISGLCGE